MDFFDTTYMYQNEWTTKTKNLFEEDKLEKNLPIAVEVVNGILLPQKDGEKPWGTGCCLDENKNLVETSIVYGAYGDKYEFNEKNVEHLHETVVFIPIIPKQWGHFLIDVVSRLWIFLDERYDVSNLKIYYNSWGFENRELTSNYKKFLEYLGIYDRMVPVQHPIQVDKVLIPSYTMSFAESYHPIFQKTCAYVVNEILKSEAIKNYTQHDYVYFSRTRLDTSKWKEIGENHIEKMFEDAGFTILRPEAMSLEEQVFIFQTSKCIAGLSGTVMHNIVFSSPSVKFYILNRTCMPNHPQLMINKLYPNEVFLVDVYSNITVKHPKDYGSGPFLLECNKNVQQMMLDICGKDSVYEKLTVIEYIKYYLSLFWFSATRSELAKFVYYHLLKK